MVPRLQRIQHGPCAQIERRVLGTIGLGSGLEIRGFVGGHPRRFGVSIKIRHQMVDRPIQEQANNAQNRLAIRCRMPDRSKRDCDHSQDRCLAIDQRPIHIKEDQPQIRAHTPS